MRTDRETARNVCSFKNAFVTQKEHLNKIVRQKLFKNLENVQTEFLFIMLLCLLHFKRSHVIQYHYSGVLFPFSELA